MRKGFLKLPIQSLQGAVVLLGDIDILLANGALILKFMRSCAFLKNLVSSHNIEEKISMEGGSPCLFRSKIEALLVSG